MNSFSCVITGHRPTRFKFKYNEKDKRCQRIKKCLQEQLIRLYNQGANEIFQESILMEIGRTRPEGQAGKRGASTMTESVSVHRFALLRKRL